MIQNLKPINPLLKTRYLVILPEIFNIEPFQVTKIKLPKMEHSNIFGNLPWKVAKYSDFEIEVLNTLESSPSKILHDNMINGSYFDIRVEILDNIGIVVTEYLIRGIIKSIELNEFEYGSQETFKINLILSVNTFVIN